MSPERRINQFQSQNFKFKYYVFFVSPNNAECLNRAHLLSSEIQTTLRSYRTERIADSYVLYLNLHARLLNGNESLVFVYGQS